MIMLINDYACTVDILDEYLSMEFNKVDMKQYCAVYDFLNKAKKDHPDNIFVSYVYDVGNVLQFVGPILIDRVVFYVGPLP